MNPYLHPVWSQWPREGHHGGARALPVDLGRVYGLSDEHRDAALAMRIDDPIHGERNAAFMVLCREITTQRFGQPQADGD